MRVLVTGGAGFIGSHLVDALLARGDEVVVLDNLSTGRRENLAQHAGNARLTFLEGTITDPADVASAVGGCALIFHLAAAIGVRYVVDDPLGGIRTNVRGTEEVLAAAHREGARVVLASSSEVYGKAPAGRGGAPLREDMDSLVGPTTVTRWWYALAKGLDEHLGLAYHRRHELPVSAVRYFNIYGPRCDPRGYGVLARFVAQALAGEPITIFGDGRQTRSFTYVNDAVRATVLAGALPAAAGEVFNVGSAREVSVADAAALVLRLTASASPVIHQEFHAIYGEHFEDTRRRVPDVTKAEQLLGFSAGISLEEGVRHTVDWWRMHTGRQAN